MVSEVLEGVEVGGRAGEGGGERWKEGIRMEGWKRT